MKFLLLLGIHCFVFTLLGQAIWMTPNKGQWVDTIDFTVPVNQGRIHVGQEGMNFYLYELPSHEELETNPTLKTHSIHQRFLGIKNHDLQFKGKPSSHYSNYFIGSDQSKWVSEIYDVNQAEYASFYEGIDLFYSTQTEKLEYGFKLQAHADPSDIQFIIEGASQVSINKKNELVITHRFGEIIESAPKAWTFLNGVKKPVDISYRLNGNVCGFDIAELNSSYDSLLIDPSLTFSSFSGSSADNWGFTATPDAAGNLYGAGIVFGYGYPTTPGAYDITYNNGAGGMPFDIGITKFNPSGTNLLYSIYFGGAGNETPHSIVSGPTGELYVYGVTCSSNFPTTAGAYDATYNGGPSVTENSLTFDGSDIFISRFSTNGANLIASTYLGGSNSDGLNLNNLHYNYGDQFRGEIILDASGNVYISSTTASNNFPTTGGAFSTVLNGLQDAVVCKLSNNLNSLLWSSYFGGIGEDSGNSIEISPNGSVYLAGGSTSPNFPGVSSGNDLSNNGGLSDGYVARFNPGNGSVVSATFMGANEYDQTYFVRCDPSNQVYVYGQTESNWQISPGCIGTPNSGQFLRKYDTGLGAIQWSTVFGSGSGHVEISPTAFLVSDCYEIYVSGWGGQLNANSAVSQAVYSTTNGFLITPNAYQNTTNGSNFYLAVFAPDASLLNYGTYMGGLTSSSNHVDGGTSRFDKKGRIYHAVCGACGGNNFGFTSTPGSWSPQNPSPNCNMAVFKFDLSTLDAVLAQPSPLICIPQPVVFNNNSVNGNTYSWDFGDNSTSNQYQPSHQYNAAGVYTVTLIVSDSANCYEPDTAIIQVNIGDFQGGVTIPSQAVCPGAPFQLDAFGGSTYAWTPANALSNPSIPNPVATISSNTIFTVIISDSCGSDTLQVPLNVVPLNLSLSTDTSICIGGQVPLSASGIGAITWSPNQFLSSNSGANVVASPDSSITYVATLTTPEGCSTTDSVRVNVYYDPPSANLPDTLVLCQGTSTSITASGASTYLWSPNQYISAVNQATVTLWPTQEMYYFCDFTNACGTVTDSVYIDILTASIFAGNDTIICPRETANLWASGGLYYQWSPAYAIIEQTGNQVWVSPNTSTNFQVVGTDINGCKDTAYVEVVLHPLPTITISPDIQAFYGDLVELNAVGNSPGAYVWSPPEFLSCINCPDPIANPDMDYTYVVTFTDLNGCIADAMVSISYEAVIYVPNTFIPDGNGRNDFFGVYGGNIKTMEMLIFNRWGELIKTLNSLSDQWDGTYDGQRCPDGVYTWKLTYTDKQERKYGLEGHVVLIR